MKEFEWTQRRPVDFSRGKLKSKFKMQKVVIDVNNKMFTYFIDNGKVIYIPQGYLITENIKQRK